MRKNWNPASIFFFLKKSSTHKGTFALKDTFPIETIVKKHHTKKKKKENAKFSKISKILPSFSRTPPPKKTRSELASNSRACHQGELATRLKGSKRAQKGPKGPKKGPKGLKRGPKGQNLPKILSILHENWPGKPKFRH